MSIRLCAVLLVLSGTMLAQQAPVGYDDTPMQPNGKWRVHDGKRPQPRMVAPGDGVAATPVNAPQDATVLVGPRADLSAWQMMDGSPVTWAMSNGVLETGKGLIRTKAEFTDVQLHVEFATPKEVKGDSQGRGNSGVFLLGKFEIQVLDSYHNPTYPDGQASAMYGQFPPLVNASKTPGEWQTYDIVFTAPRFAAGKLEKPASGDGVSQRDRRAQRHAVLGTDRAQEDRSVHARQRERADRPAGSRQPGALPEHLDQAADWLRRHVISIAAISSQRAAS